MSKASRYLFFALAALFLARQPATYAHKPSDSYLNLRLDETGIKGRWSISLRDLDIAIGLDLNNDRAITWGEVKAQRERLVVLAKDNLRLRTADSFSNLEFSNLLIDRLSDGAYAVLDFKTTSPVTGSARIVYNFLFDIDAQHRGIMTISRSGRPPEIAFFTPENREFVFSSGGAASARGFAALVRHGVWHIWKGFDHLLFLFALLLPAVLKFQDGKWEVVARFPPILIQVAKVVTAFTLAHSITLSLAVLGVVALPSVLVESIIAGSVVFAAVNNFHPMVAKQSWIVAFIFGLVHGFGFASVFADLGLKGGDILSPLLAFNLGVELGQLVIVMLFLPIAFVLRRSPVYRIIFLQYGSAVIALVATTWMAERILHFKVLPF